MAVDLAALEAELKRDPGSRRFGDLAREYQRIGRLQEAEDLCQKGLARYPNQWQARLLLAQIYVAKGKLQEAREAVDRILMALPDHVAANHLAGDIYYALEERPRALRHYQIVELFEPGRPGVYEKIEELSSASSEPQEAHGAISAAPVEKVAAAAEAPVTNSDTRALAEPAESSAKPTIPETVSPIGGGAPVEKAGSQSIDLGGTVKMEAWKEPGPPPSKQEEEKAVPELRLEGEPLIESGGEDLLDTLGDGKELSVMSAEPLSFGEAPVEKEPFGSAAEGIGSSNENLAEAEKKEGNLGTMAEPSHVAEVLQPAEPLREEGAAGLNTVTLAELYAKQGFPEKAVEIYQRVLLANPENEDVKQRIRGLMRRMDGDAPEFPEVRQEDVRMALRQRRVKLLEGWLRRVRYERHV